MQDTTNSANNRLTSRSPATESVMEELIAPHPTAAENLCTGWQVPDATDIEDCAEDREYVPLDVVLSFARAESLLKTWQAIGYPPHQSTKTLPTDFMLRRPALRQAIFRLDEMLKTEVGNIWTTIAENLSAASTGEGHASASS